MVGDIPRMERLFEWLQTFRFGSFWTGNSPDFSTTGEGIRDVVDDESEEVFSDDTKSDIVLIPRPLESDESMFREAEQNVAKRRALYRRVILLKLALVGGSIGCAYFLLLCRLRPRLRATAGLRGQNVDCMARGGREVVEPAGVEA
jgi:hypothetical protein